MQKDNNMKKITLLATLLGLVACSPKIDPEQEANTPLQLSHDLQQIINSDHRSEDNRSRDVYRNPHQTLEFFDIRPHHHVLEISPGGGWYTEILAPYLRQEGQLTLAIFSEDSPSEFRRNLNRNLKQKLEDSPDIYDRVQLSVFEPPVAMELPVPTESVDRIVTFRNVHSWMGQGKAQEVFNVFYEALRPGGVLGVVQHRAKNSKEDQDPKAESGYVSQDYVIAMAKKAGFRLEAYSEINANPQDSADHPSGVWTLPPALRLGDENREHYLSIGESDRMTLKFVK